MAVTVSTPHIKGSGNNRDIHYRISGKARSFNYSLHVTDPAFDADAHRTPLQAKFETVLATGEVERWVVGEGSAVEADDATTTQYAKKWREEYANEIEGRRIVLLAWKMKTAYDNGHFDDETLKAAWKKNQSQLNSFMVKLEAQRMKHEGMKNEVSE